MIGRRGLLHATSLAAVLGTRSSRLLADDAGATLSGDFLLRQGGTPQNLATPLEYFDRLITPTAVFFVRSHFGPPANESCVPRTTAFDGLVKTRLSMSVDELRKQFRETTVTAMLQCAGNGRALHRPRVPGLQWEHGAMGQATFTGVRLRDVLEKAGIDKAARYVRLVGADAPPKPAVPAFIRSLPIERAMDPSTILAFRMNGHDLTLAHGGPTRLVVPGWAGDHWVKWLALVRAEKEEADGFFMKTGYRVPTEPVAPGSAVPPEKMQPATTFPVKSVIARPASGARTPVGAQDVVGLAFSGEAPIAAVEVSIDGGKTFARASLEGEPGVGRAQVFRFKFTQSKPGRVRASARARDAKGNVQPETSAWNPSGYFWNGYHAVEWEVGT